LQAFFAAFRAGLLRPHLQLVLNTEPFAYRTVTWFRGVRSQVGLEFHLWPGITAQALYWNWWTGYGERRVRWQHTVLLTATFRLAKMRWHRRYD
jgi:hypothetical protein